MNSQIFQLLKKLLPGLLPLIIFIIVDEIWGTKAGLVVAIVFGLGELIAILLKEKRVDKFILFDTGLLVLLGVVSIISANEIFFKLKPAFINIIFCVIIGLSAYSDKNILLSYSKRYFKDIPDDSRLQQEMQRTFRALFWIFVIHTLLIVYSAFYMSKEAWGFISGVLIYILFGAYFLWQFSKNYFRRKKGSKPEEWLPLVDEEGAIIGKAPRRLVHGNPDLLHPVIHLHIVNNAGEIYLQKRPLNKDVQPGKWDTAVGGHIASGETIDQALVREAREELGLSGLTVYPIGKYRWNTSYESELTFSFLAKFDGQPVPDKTELDGGKFWKMTDIEKEFGKGILSENFEHEYETLKHAILTLRKSNIKH